MADTTITVDPQDVSDASNFLEQYLTDNDPTGDFSRGTALRDHTVGAIAAIYAFLRAEITQIRQLQSLNSVSTATGGDATALKDAVTAILSNVFIAPKEGVKSRGVAIVHLSQQVDVFVQTAHQFTRSEGLIFTVDSTDTWYMAAANLVPIVDSSNVIVEYQCQVPLVAIRTGEDFNIEPGYFAAYDRFNPYITNIENTDPFSGGRGSETVEEILTRAPTALSVRNLINERSITATLDDNFSEIRSLYVAGMGDVEMQRDTVELADHLAIHIGGAVDIYPLMDLVETSYTGSIGGSFARPDGVICILRDAIAGPFPATIFPGDVVRITAGLTNVPKSFKVIQNLTTSLVISEQTPFPEATDEASPVGFVSYTVGRTYPVFNDVFAGVGGIPLTTGTTSRSVLNSGRITMPGTPVMDILDVAVIDPLAGEAAFMDPTDGFVHFPVQVNTTPSEAALPVDGLQYQVIIHNPDKAQSSQMWMEIVVGTDTNVTRFDGCTLRVTYKTLTGFSSINSFITSTDERTVAASQLLRGHNPVTLEIVVNYKLRSDATEELDSLVMAQSIADFISAFDTTVVPLDTSVLMDFIRTVYPSIASVQPLTITYFMLAPTGDRVTYQTTDEVTIDSTKQILGPVLDLVDLGITSRTIRYLANSQTITVLQVF